MKGEWERWQKLEKQKHLKLSGEKKNGNKVSSNTSSRVNSQPCQNSGLNCLRCTLQNPYRMFQLALILMIRENTDEKMIPFNCDKSRRTHLQLATKGTEEVNTILAVKRLTRMQQKQQFYQSGWSWVFCLISCAPTSAHLQTRGTAVDNCVNVITGVHKVELFHSC